MILLIYIINTTIITTFLGERLLIFGKLFPETIIWRGTIINIWKIVPWNDY